MSCSKPLISTGLHVNAGINDPFVDASYSAYMMKYDSVHGRYEDVQADGDSIIVSGHKVHCFSEM